jgi:pimeloyl-ACP methyl ester carboxylesterase
MREAADIAGTDDAGPIPIPHVAGVRHRFLDVRGERIHVAEAGDGPPLLLLHGWPQHWYCWHRVVPRLRDFSLVMPDMRGFGWSSVPASGYDKENLADDALALLDTLGLERVGVVGHDWGGWTGFLMGLRAPERVAALLAVSVVHPFVSLDARTVAESWRFGYQFVLGSPLARIALRQPRLLDAMLTAETDAITEPRVYSRVIAQPARARASELLYRTFLLRDLARLHRYRDDHLEVPTMLVVGDRDPVIRPAMLGGYEGHTTAMTVEVVHGAGHFVPEQSPDVLVGFARAAFEPWRSEHAAVAAGGAVTGVDGAGQALIEGPNSA